jgi:hypothetical protein
MRCLPRGSLLIAVLVLPAAVPAAAELCSIDARPAATLLLPYFEVDLDDPNGVTTLFSINNAKGSPALAHVVFWTDWSYPTLSFDVYLTGYDVLSVNVRDVFLGKVPLTADALSDPGQGGQGTRSPCGGQAQNRHWDDADAQAAGEQGFPFCEQILPTYSDPILVGEALERVILSHTGRTVPALDSCVGSEKHDDVARGYVSIDSVSE